MPAITQPTKATFARVTKSRSGFLSRAADLFTLVFSFCDKKPQERSHKWLFAAVAFRLASYNHKTELFYAPN